MGNDNYGGAVRRKDREITDKLEIEDILGRAMVMRLAMCSGGEPYVVPLNFAYQDGCIYFHSARQGKKTDILRENNRVCFQADAGVEIRPSENACSWGMKYQSVIGWGRAFPVEDPEEKKRGLAALMKHYSGKSYDFTGISLDNLLIVRIEIDEMTGKKSC
jgi:hypothetical protein